MINFVGLLITCTIVCFVCTIVGYIMDKKSKRSYNNWDGLYFVGITLGIILLATTIMSAAWFYSEAISLPYEYRSACDTVDETKELLMQFNQTDIGYGLEALELKQTLSGAIKEKNELTANIRSWLNNPLMPYRAVLENGLPNNFVR